MVVEVGIRFMTLGPVDLWGGGSCRVGLSYVCVHELLVLHREGMEKKKELVNCYHTA